MYQINFNFLGLKCLIESDEASIISKIEKDFSNFKSAPFKKSEVDYYFRHQNISPPFDKIPNFKEVYRSKNSITYEENGVRFNNYHGKLLSIYDYKKEICSLYSTNLEKTHEVIYLLIHSRVGKKLDLLGLHRIHAMGVRKNDSNLIVMMSSGVGKSTLLENLLSLDLGIEFLSDDCPLVDDNGVLYPFPIRLGANNSESFKKLAKERDCFYMMDREFYGKKYLLDSKCLNNKIGKSSVRKNFLFHGIRLGKEECRIEKSSKLKTLLQLQKHMVVGVGLPMILEYWWELGVEDFVRKAVIGIKRFFSAIVLVLKSDCFEIELGNDPEKNARTLIKFLNW